MTVSPDLIAVLAIVGAAAVILAFSLVRAGRGRSCCSAGADGPRRGRRGFRRTAGPDLSLRSRDS